MKKNATGCIVFLMHFFRADFKSGIQNLKFAILKFLYIVKFNILKYLIFSQNKGKGPTMLHCYFNEDLRTLYTNTGADEYFFFKYISKHWGTDILT